MDFLEGTLKHYEWGSNSDLANFRGFQPSGRPEAELWFDSKETDPWLIKVLAVETPLSLQVHPNSIEAVTGFEYENSIGISIGSSERLFKDAKAKPEFVCALTPFITFGGFKEFDEIIRTVSSLEMPKDLISVLKEEGIRSVPEVFRQIIEGRWIDHCESLLDSCISRKGLNISNSFASALVGINDLYPRDPALMILPFLQLHCMQPGDGLYIGTGTPHCYLSGMAIEFMPLSENVVRGGFTRKTIDRRKFVDMIDFEQPFTGVQVPDGGLHVYNSFINGMGICRIKSSSFASSRHHGKELIVCVDGEIFIEAEKEIFFSKGEALLIDAEIEECKLEVNGEAYIATFSSE